MEVCSYEIRGVDKKGIELMARKYPKDPAQQLLKAYYRLLNGSIFYADQAVRVGTRIPQNTDNYVLIYIEDFEPMNTGDAIIFNVTVALQIVSMQETTEGDDTITNSIFDQVISLVGDPEGFIMDGFHVETSNFEGSEYLPELTDTNYIITRKLRMSNIIEQTR